jgi:GTP-binding protein Era
MVAENSEKTPAGHRSGYVTIVGRPNVGKSTLLNQLLGQKIAIVSPKPQTTRNRIAGIRTTDASQTIFLDTPGIHRARSLINRRMVDVALNTLTEVDGILWLVDARDGLRKDDEEIAERLQPLRATIIVLLNKIDLIAKGKLLPLIERCAQLLPGREIIPISAMKGDGVELVLDRIEKLLPEGPRYYTEGEVTDQTERFLAAEIVREKVFIHTREEIPYGTAVTIDEFTEKLEKNLVVVKATIHVERETHKPILIGKRGSMLKEIGTEAREELEKILGCKVFLELFIRVDPGWTQDPNALSELGL